MKANKLTLVRCLASKFSLICMLMLFGLTNAFAQGKQSSVLYLEAGDIVLGQENTFSLVLDNGATEVAGMNFNIVLPKGITFDEPNKENKFVANRTRLTNHHKLTIDPKAGVPGEYVITIFPSQVKVIKNNAQGEGKGEIAQLILKVDENFLDMDNKDIKLHSIAMSDATGKVKPFEDQLKGKEFAYAVRPLMGTLVGEQEAVSIYNGESATIGVALDNRNIVTSLQFDLHLPQGLKMDKDEDGDFVFIKSNRIPNHDFICKEHGNKISVVLHSMSGWNINGIENSNLFSFKVNAAKDFNAEGGEVVIDNIVMADATGASYPTKAVVKVNVKNLTGDKVAVENKIAELKKALEAAEKHITENCADVKEAWLAADNAQKKAIVDRVAALEKNLAAAVKNLTIAAEKEALLKDAAEIQTLVEEYQAAADKAQAEFVSSEAAKKANEEAYKKLSEQIAGVQAELDAANKKVAEEAKDVAAQFAVTAKALQSQIDAKAAEVKKAYDEVKLTAESVVDTKAISEAIAKMVTDAQAAQAAHEANEAANAKLNEQLAGVQAELDAANKTLAEECKNVAAQFEETAAALQAQVDAKKAEVKKAYEEGALNAESVVDTKAISEAIAKMVTDAQAAQKAYEEEQAKLAANEEAYAKLSAELEALQVEVEKAEIKVATECKDVADKFKMSFFDLKQKVVAMGKELKASYDKKELTAESTVDAAAVRAEIEKILTQAAADQKAFEDDKAKYEANEAAYKTLSAQLDKVQKLYDDTKFAIAVECKDVVADFTKVFDEIQSAIDAMYDQLNADYAAQKLTADSKLDIRSIEKQINQVKFDAQLAQNKFETDQIKRAANEKAYSRIQKDVEKVQEVLNAAIETIQKEYAIIADQFKGENVQALIDKLNADLKAKYEAVELDETSSVDVEVKDIEKAVEQLLADAKKAFIATGIDGVSAEDATIEAVYTLTGKRIEKPVRGWNIVKYSNGFVKKLYLK